MSGRKEREKSKKISKKSKKKCCHTWFWIGTGKNEEYCLSEEKRKDYNLEEEDEKKKTERKRRKYWCKCWERIEEKR